MPSSAPTRRPALRRWLLPAAGVAAVAVVVVLALSGGSDRPAPSGRTASGVLGTGAAAPAVVLPSTEGRTVDLSAYRGKRNVLLYFYEHAG